MGCIIIAEAMRAELAVLGVGISLAVLNLQLVSDSRLSSSYFGGIRRTGRHCETAKCPTRDRWHTHRHSQISSSVFTQLNALRFVAKCSPIDRWNTHRNSQISSSVFTQLNALHFVRRALEQRCADSGQATAQEPEHFRS